MAENIRAIEKELMTIPGVGKSIARDLTNIGIRSLAELRNHEPMDLYESLCRYQNVRVDRCVLYVFRVAVYVASTPEEKRDPNLLKWWNWKGPEDVAAIARARKDKPGASSARKKLKGVPQNVMDALGGHRVEALPMTKRTKYPQKPCSLCNRRARHWCGPCKQILCVGNCFAAHARTTTAQEETEVEAAEDTMKTEQSASTEGPPRLAPIAIPPLPQQVHASSIPKSAQIDGEAVTLL